jgi:hypothetical protein
MPFPTQPPHIVHDKLAEEREERGGVNVEAQHTGVPWVTLFLQCAQDFRIVTHRHLYLLSMLRDAGMPTSYPQGGSVTAQAESGYPHPNSPSVGHWTAPEPLSQTLGSLHCPPVVQQVLRPSGSPSHVFARQLQSSGSATPGNGSQGASIDQAGFSPQVTGEVHSHRPQLPPPNAALLRGPAHSLPPQHFHRPTHVAADSPTRRVPSASAAGAAFGPVMHSTATLPWNVPSLRLPARSPDSLMPAAPLAESTVAASSTTLESTEGTPSARLSNSAGPSLKGALKEYASAINCAHEHAQQAGRYGTSQLGAKPGCTEVHTTAGQAIREQFLPNGNLGNSYSAANTSSQLPPSENLGAGYAPAYTATDASPERIPLGHRHPVAGALAQASPDESPTYTSASPRRDVAAKMHMATNALPQGIPPARSISGHLVEASRIAVGAPLISGQQPPTAETASGRLSNSSYNAAAGSLGRSAQTPREGGGRGEATGELHAIPEDWQAWFSPNPPTASAQSLSLADSDASVLVCVLFWVLTGQEAGGGGHGPESSVHIPVLMWTRFFPTSHKAGCTDVRLHA